MATCVRRSAQRRESATFNRQASEVTLNDLWVLDLTKLDGWTCLFHGAAPEETVVKDESSDDSDESDESDDDDDEDDDDSDNSEEEEAGTEDK